jgi:ribose transport system ATP-binding protein
VTTDVLRLDSITKTFGAATALSGVSFTVRSGEVHALVGENGAGKSTLMGVAAGALAPDSGTVEIGGRRLSRVAPVHAQELGLAVVYQHATTLDDLTVAENLLLAVPRAQRPSGRDSDDWVRRHLSEVGSSAGPTDRAEDLGPAQRQLVEIARAFALNSLVLVLDEPTESLTEAESDLLFEQVGRLRERGTGIVYISHRFPEVRRLAARISVLRDGRLRGTFDAADVTEEQVLELIVGREVDHVFPARRTTGAGDPVLEVVGLTGARFTDVALTARAGEILGLAGVEGNGQRDVLRSLAGLGAATGEIEVRGRRVDIRTPSDAADVGVVHLPGDRHVEGVFLPMTVRENASALVLDRVSRLGVIDRRADRALAERAVESLSIRAAGTEAPVSSLSGGNQQKVLFARSLEAAPTVLLADEPTRGVDVGARVEIYRLLREFADEGNAVVVLSSDAVELAGLSDRVLVFSRGQVVRELAADELSERAITGAAITSTVQRSAAAQVRTGWGSRIRALARGDYAPSAVLAILLLVLVAVVAAKHPLFLSTRNISGVLLLTAVLSFVAFGQLTVLLAASIDLSVGPLVGLAVVVMSFFATGGAGAGGLALGVLACAVLGLLVGVINGVGVRLVGLPPVIATLVSFIVLQGLALLLRPTPDGYIDSSVIKALQTKFGPVPAAMIVVLVLCLLLERILRATDLGRRLRAVGSDEDRARRVGVPVDVVVVLAHVVCAVLAAVGGIVLTSLIGVGQAGIGSQYTLTSIAAVVLGGASIFGGRGSYVGALLGALLLQTIVSATSFLNLAQAWQQWLPGLLVLGGAAIFSGARRRAAHLASTGQE